MPLCGFNTKMLQGLRMFNEGLIEHGLVHRSEINNESIDQAIKRELSDMARFLINLDSLNDSSKKVLSEGMIKYAMGFYLLIRKNGIQESKDLLERLENYFEKMDSHYYSNLDGSPDDMEQLVSYLNTINLT